MVKADKYISKIRSLYRLDDRILNAFNANKHDIEKKLKPYYWEDVERCIERFFATKDSSNYPRVEQIIALLNSDRATRKEIPTAELDIPKPHTNIAFIQDCFLEVCRFVHREGIIWVEYCAKVENIPHGNKMFIKKIKKQDETYDDILANKEWIIDDLIKDKESGFPDVYFKFPGMRKIERYAFAYKLGVLNIK